MMALMTKTQDLILRRTRDFSLFHNIQASSRILSNGWSGSFPEGNEAYLTSV